MRQGIEGRDVGLKLTREKGMGFRAGGSGVARPMVGGSQNAGNPIMPVMGAIKPNAPGVHGVIFGPFRVQRDLNTVNQSLHDYLKTLQPSTRSPKP